MTMKLTKMNPMKMDGASILVVLAVVLFIAAPVIWAVRLEGQVKKHTADLVDFKADVKEMKADIKLILEKL